MANIKSAIKRIKKTKRQHEENLAHRTKVKTFVKKTNTVIQSEDKAAIATSLKETIKILDTVARKGVIHKNKAARLKSRLTKKANALASENAAAAKKSAPKKSTAKKTASASKQKTTTKAKTKA